jgi:ribonuclease P protein component
MASWPGRLGDRRTFMALRRPACRVRRGEVTIAWVSAAPVASVRVAYGVGRSVGTSVKRNLARRRLRSVVAEAYRQGELVPGSYLVSVGRGVGGLSFDELRAATREALTTVGRCSTGGGVEERVV